MIKIKKEYILFGNASGELLSDYNLVNFYLKMVELKKSDREHNIKDTYYCEIHNPNIKNNTLDMYDVKIYRRGNKVFIKYL